MKYADFDLFNIKEFLKDKEIIVYGAGNCGKQVGEMLCDMGYKDYVFCDQDSNKWGTMVVERPVKALSEIAVRGGRIQNTVIIIAIESAKVQKEVEDLLSVFGNITVISFFACKCYWKYSRKEYQIPKSYLQCLKANAKSEQRTYELVSKAIDSDVVIYQRGKVGSSSMFSSLLKYSINCANLHYFFLKNDINKWLLWGEDYCRHLNPFDNSSYEDFVKLNMRHKKVIVLVRDPIARGISNFFEMMKMEESPMDWYLSREFSKDSDFIQAIEKYMEKDKGSMLDWFKDELERLYGIDIFRYPFDRNRGYGLIHEKHIDILCMKMEKLDTLEGVIAEFLGLPEFKLERANIGKRKAYSLIYKETKKQIHFSEEYLDYYYKDNSKMDYFYTKEEQAIFRNRWTLEE